MQASVTSAQNGCSPWWLRCSDQLMLTVVRVAAISRASAVMRDAGMPVIFSAQAGVLGAGAAEGANFSKPTVQRSRKSRSCRFSASSVWQSASDQRGVGVGPDRQPLDVAAGVEIVGRRRDVDEAHALVAHAVEARP